MNQKSMIGRQIDEYRLESLLGEGGMASVYRALDTRLNRYVAVKVILASLRSESDYMMRFQREAQAIAQLEHPGIITLYRFGEASGVLYMAMQYVDGADLAAVIDSFHRDGAFIEFEEIIRLAHEIGAALDYAHSRGVIHRDIKPHNILITQDGRAIVSDFGLALLTEIGTRGEIFGSPHYIAPEQAISSAGVVPQSDLYALGVILYEMLTGQVPFDAAEPLEIAMMHMSYDVPSPRALRPELHPRVEAVLLKALAKQPDERYPSGKELATALENALQSRPIHPAKTQHTIPQRVALELEANPLPPLPASVTQVTPPRPAEKAETLPPPAEQTVVSAVSVRTTGNPLRSLVIGGAAGLLLLAALLVIWNLLQGGSPESAANPTQTAEQSAAVNPTDQPSLPAANTDTPAVVPSQTPPPAPTNTLVAAVPAAQAWALMIRWEGEDSLFVQNISTIDFPLPALELSGNGILSGTEWGVSVLAPGQCVAVWKESGNPQAANTSCELVGERLTRQGSDRFWKASFAVKFNGLRIEVCETSPCLIQIQAD